MRRSLIWSLGFIVVAALASICATVFTDHAPLLGLDLKGGLEVVLKPDGAVTGSQLNTAVSIIDRRVDGFGVSNSNVTKQGNDVVIELPGIKNAQAALNTLGETAVLYFRPVYCTIPAYAPPAKSATTTTVPKTSTTTTKVSESDCENSNAASLKTTPVAQDTAKNDVILAVDPAAYGKSGTDIRYVLGPADMTGSIISSAAAEVDPNTGQYSVNFNLNNKGSTKFDNMATSRYACYLQDTGNPPFCSLEAFDLDGLVESAPTFQTSSFNGQVSITGDFTSSQASALANVLKYGSLPVKFSHAQAQTISASVGEDSLHVGLLAGLGGLIVVMLYMLLYYRALGVVVLVGLGVGGALLYSIITLLGHTENLTLTLSGITGIIVSIGITVDSYIVYFERLKDEVRSGRTVRQSVERSFSRAFKTVLTADLVSFMAALILYLLTVGDVRGFAFMLGLSTLLDVVTAYLFIRPAVILVGRRRSIVDNRLFGISKGLGARTAGQV